MRKPTLLTTNLGEYLLPTAPEIPKIDLIHRESPTDRNPIGVKGAGEGGTIPVPAAVIAAVEDALKPFGVVINHTPLSPQGIVALIQGGIKQRNKIRDLGMFTFLTPHHPFASQTLRLAAEASQGGGDVFEIARCCERIELGDKDSWEREWIALAEKTEVWAREALDSGHPVSARNYFFHANNYWRMADVFLLGFDPRRAHYFSKAQECFREG